MKIEKAEVITEGGYAELHLVIDGHAAQVFEPKLTLLENDVVVLLDDDGYWKETVSVDYFSEDHAAGVAIAGGVRDAELVVLVKRYLAGEAGNLLEGN